MSTIINPGDSLSPHEKIEALFVSREENGEAGDSRDQEFAKFLSCQRMCNARVLQILRGESHYLEE